MNAPPAGVPAPRADEPVWPAQPLQVVQTVSVGAEPGLELPGRPRVVPARPWLPPVHGTSLVRSAEYPQPTLMGVPAVWVTVLTGVKLPLKGKVALFARTWAGLP